NTSDDNPSTSGELRDGPHHDLIDGDPTGCQEELTDNHQNAEAEPNSVNEGPPLKSKSFVSWNEFHAYLDTYQAQTYQMFRVRSNKSVAARNQIISRDKSKENTLGAVRESALVSRHAHWTAKHSQRSGQVSFKLYVTKTKLVHNHPLFPVRSEEQTNSEAKDHGTATVAEQLHKWMLEFSEEEGNIGRIFVDLINEKKIATCVTIQTRSMREMFDRFPEVLLIDATHGTNSSKYKVFSFMAHDCFGHGQYVQHALVQNERYETLQTAIETFKKHNPAWEKLRCVVIDKDFTEMSVLKASFPNVVVLLCQFHVIKYLHGEIANSDYGFSSWQKEQLRAVVYLLVYASTE
ncbi:hypothetical protein PF010_g31192, partial [Phytophthora fragariae]